MKKMLMVATVPSMIGQFNMDNIQMLLEMGYQVHVACNMMDRSVWNDKRVYLFEKQLSELKVPVHQINFSRSPLKIGKHIKSYKQMFKLLYKGKFDFIHCQTPIASVISRMVSHKLKIKVIYTAHGFNFYKGGPIKNWLIFYPIEKFFSRWTDILITINKEDYKRAKKYFHSSKVMYVPGVGVDIDKFDKKYDVENLRASFGIQSDVKVILSVGELNKRKNHESVIRALANMNEVKNESVHYIIVGQGKLKNRLMSIIKELNMEKNVSLLGFRTDVAELYDLADIYVFPSYREGLSVALMEAMASRLPIACSNIRGNIDLVDEHGGVLFNPKEINDIRVKLSILINMNKTDLAKLGMYNHKKINNFDRHTVDKSIKRIYSNFIVEENGKA
jgi:glycosyltransferase involved in cell wall biosynthesis